MADQSCSRKRKQEVTDEEEHDAVHEDEQAADEEELHIDAVHEPEQQAAPAIFLSHSGAQKPFVEQLDKALRRTNHTPFFDQETLRKGSRFPPSIEHAARGCKLGVVVLSDNFVTTKWPMLELEMLLSRREPRLVFPLFYKLSPSDLKDSNKLEQWRKEWEKLALKHEKLKIESCENLLRVLDSFNDEIYSPKTSEDDYIKRVVRQICNLVPSYAPYDLSQIRGHEYLAQEVAGLFDHRRMVGLHGVGGLGKTTMCKIMVNFYNSKYPGRSCLMEFPTDGNKKNIIVEECKRFLKQIFHLSEEHLLNNIHEFDQVISLMRDHSREYDVFIAMDNIWSSSLEEARKILQVFKDFRSGNKILLTSRSKGVIQDLLEPHGNPCVESLPTLKEAEAVQIFEDSLGRDDVKALFRFVSKPCVFHQIFHPLALKAVGKYVKGVCNVEGEQNIELVMKDNMIESVEDAVRINYERLSDVKKHIFLDIACLLPRLSYDITSELSYTELLSLLYKDSKSKSDISNLINELALDGLIDYTVKRDIGANQIITVHDLYVELGQKEVAKSLRFFVGGISSFKMEEIQWKRLERVEETRESDLDKTF